MRDISRAKVQYDDMVGTTALDWADSGPNLNGWLEHLGGDSEIYYPICIEMYWGGRIGGVTVHIHAVERVKALPTEDSTIPDYLASFEGVPIPVKTFSGDSSLEEFFASAKRFRFVMFDKPNANRELTLASDS